MRGVVNLSKRLDALEQLAEGCRRREMRALVLTLEEARCLSPAELEAATDEALDILDEVRALKRRGLADREIAARLGARR